MRGYPLWMVLTLFTSLTGIGFLTLGTLVVLCGGGS